MIAHSRRTFVLATMLVVLSSLSACMSVRKTDVPAGTFALSASENASAQTPAQADEQVFAGYKLDVLDEVNVKVFKEPDLSVASLPLDLDGTVSLPLIGSLRAAGLTTTELAALITNRLNQRYLRDAQVAVTIAKSVNFTVTVDGEVKKPGVFSIPGRLTLLQAVALAEGTTEFARQQDVFVFRKVDGRRYAARFDLSDIRAARAVDPAIHQSDLVVVGFSRAKRFQRDLVTSLPGLTGLFVLLR